MSRSSSEQRRNPPTRATLLAAVVIAAAALEAGCEVDPAQARFGLPVAGLTLRLFSDDVGVHPSKDILADPENPFAVSGVGAETKWELLADGGNVAAFYAWGTLLAKQPTGEHQFYTARMAAAIAGTGAVPDADRARLRAIALRGFQAVLDAFPESVTFDALGSTAFRLATPAYQAIIDLGGRPRGDWVVVATPDGGREVVRGSNVPNQVPTSTVTAPVEDEEDS